ncbi:MAG: Chromosome partition protein Smc [Luteibacter sp.]|uniref:hypothetical protein n=1 Tax=Luteibacter sp. TaxID=1886636 RepID=UPI001380CEA5|nr:hypothetical protein [Luteibacter sp.]KAF1008994.1 MAG: Chromosome partition protein Smc [Luteibacter sp.]
MTDETKTLSEDEQFAAMTTGNPLFGENNAGGPPANVTVTEEGADTRVDDAGGDTASAADDGQDGQGAGDGTAAQPGTDGTPAAATGAEEPFPGYSSLSPEVREAFDNVSKERRKFENDYKALHGMMAPTQRQNAELRRQHDALSARIQQLEQLERTQRDASAAKDEALKGLEDWANQFPEESKMLMALVNPLRDKVTALEGQLNAARAELGSLSTERQQAALEREVSALEEQHADWREIHASPDYWEWLNRQTPGIQALNASMFAGDTIHLLNLYKGNRVAAAPAAVSASVPATQTGTADAIQQRRTQALERGTAPTVRGSESTGKPGENRDAALTDDDAAFLQLVGDNPNFR